MSELKKIDYSKRIKNRIKNNISQIIEENPRISVSEKKSAFIFSSIEMNFQKATYENICKNEDWKLRLNKRHSHFKDDTKEMQSSNSSDAMLMNIFCHPKFSSWEGPHKLLSINKSENLEFGWNPKFDNEKLGHLTEIDLKIGNTIFEAKLTESEFTKTDIEKVSAYPDYNEIFDGDLLLNKDGEISNYQLIRNIVTAHKYNFNFILLIDAERTDLLHAFIETVKAVKKHELRKRLNFITWQELVFVCGDDLKNYIGNKYF